MSPSWLKMMSILLQMCICKSCLVSSSPIIFILILWNNSHDHHHAGELFTLIKFGILSFSFYHLDPGPDVSVMLYFWGGKMTGCNIREWTLRWFLWLSSLCLLNNWISHSWILSMFEVSCLYYSSSSVIMMIIGFHFLFPLLSHHHHHPLLRDLCVPDFFSPALNMALMIVRIACGMKNDDRLLHGQDSVIHSISIPAVLALRLLLPGFSLFLCWLSEDLLEVCSHDCQNRRNLNNSHKSRRGRER